MTDVFLYGTLCHLPLLQVVLGRDARAVPAQLPGHRVALNPDGASAGLSAAQGSVAEGLLLPGLAPEDVARLNFYTACMGCTAQTVRVNAGGPVAAQTYLPTDGPWGQGADWRMADWLAAWGDVVVATARDVMALFGQATPAQVRQRYGLMLVRGASTVRAAGGGPTTRRHSAGLQDVAVVRRATPYARFFAVEEYDLQFRRFDGTLSPQVNRAVFISGDAVTVLPYDPVRDVVLLIEQFRPGPFARGDAQPWSIEAIAGRIDAGETPEQAARREAVEEAGLTLGAMEFVAGYYPTPGAKAEFLYSYIALTDLPEGVEGVFGVEGEAEDIRGHRLPFAAFEALMASGEVNNAPLLLTGQWLQRERPRLRAVSR
ncbi:MAG: NUDIX domain-containing protein [Paracoccaceae bacterium]